MPNYAVIDCGTNTFHLLIAKPSSDGSFEAVYRERRYVKLAEEGIERIGDAPYQRAFKTLQDYAVIIKQYDVRATRVSGTAALRTAENGPDFVQQVAEETGLDIQIIPGKTEAQLIHRGVSKAIGKQNGRWMIMDIGGGSVEFIISDNDTVLWYESFPVGVAVSYRRFHRSEPISEAEITETTAFFTDQLKDLKTALEQFPLEHLVGAAGTFDVLADVLGYETITPHATAVGLGKFEAFYKVVIAAGKAERYAMTTIPDSRADMIVVALILVKYIINLAGIKQLSVSQFSMKEGMLDEMM